MPDVLANKIAAGEVVQRPASVVKELIENAIDSGAGSISLVLKKSGVELIQIDDDGCGMSEADVRLCFARHATSKISSIDDLERIATLGFRGEALASIGAVSRVRLRTRQAQAVVGVEARHEGGTSVWIGPCATTPGTIVSVRNLFYNVPARRKFLKSEASELRRIIEVVQQIALSHPDISFRMEHDGRELLNASPDVHEVDAIAVAQRTSRILAVAREQLVAVSESTSYLRVTGVVGRPGAARKTRGQQVFVVNGRVVRNRYLEHAVRGAYGSLVGEGEYPLFVLFLDLSPGHVDVNVHPSKSEVKFDDERGVYSFLRAIVARSLAQADASPRLDRLGDDAAVPAGLSFSPSDWTPGGRAAGSSWFSGGDDGRLSELLLGQPSPGLGGETLNREDVDHEIRQIGNRYLVIHLRSALLIIDQRAAHERVIYERTLSALESGGGFSQQLLFPQTIDLSAAGFELARELMPELKRAGFDFDPFGGTTVVVRGVPAETSTAAIESLLPDVLDRFDENIRRLKYPQRECLARSVARCSAIRVQSRLDQREMRALVDQLLVCESPDLAPDGRPTMIRIDEAEFDRRFAT
jgi:DNA mismatch repair protein MutL